MNTVRIHHLDGMRGFSHLAKSMFASFQGDYTSGSVHRLFNNAPLRDFFNMEVDFKRIDTNIWRGYLSRTTLHKVCLVICFLKYYSQQLIELDFEDAMEKETAIKTFLSLN